LHVEQTAERTRKEAAGSGQYAGPVENTEEQRKVYIVLMVSCLTPLCCEFLSQVY